MSVIEGESMKTAQHITEHITEQTAEPDIERDDKRHGERDDERTTARDGDEAPTPAEELLYGVIRRLWPLHRRVVRAVERELTGTGLTAGEHALLDALHSEGPRTVPQLARAMDLDRQPVQRWVNHAVELGLAVTAPNPAHRRSSLIRLTTEGAAAIRGIQRFESADLHRRLADLPAEDLRTALRVLDRLGEEFRHLGNGSHVPPEETDSRGNHDGSRIQPSSPHPTHKGRLRE
ncbi:MarR family winged helix-turn-helix transcriptional regulator [Streptomyces kronopolitis]|uniref:MarR family winged helix-turn-helix transcriptional regulator n=1 Tax=Streptomyces kronopolitis TaxID=1612435 RepID=UPI0020C16038|nr:MarR family transcriptional regulator [Streptomyces kronopolitis]MCL6301216.1 MarR family transcriptional regulator [Streptomyces kronopolitis]